MFEGGNLLRRAVGGHDDLFVVLVQGVEGVEELFLGAFFTREELDVVYKEEVDVAIHVLELLATVGLYGVDELVGEGLAGNVDDLGFWVLGHHFVADGLDDVGFAETYTAKYEERIVFGAWVLCYCGCGGMGEFVAFANDVGFKGVLGVQFEIGGNFSAGRGHGGGLGDHLWGWLGHGHDWESVLNVRLGLLWADIHTIIDFTDVGVANCLDRFENRGVIFLFEPGFGEGIGHADGDLVAFDR